MIPYHLESLLSQSTDGLSLDKRRVVCQPLLRWHLWCPGEPSTIKLRTCKQCFRDLNLLDRLWTQEVCSILKEVNIWCMLCVRTEWNLTEQTLIDNFDNVVIPTYLCKFDSVWGHNWSVLALPPHAGLLINVCTVSMQCLQQSKGHVCAMHREQTQHSCKQETKTEITLCHTLSYTFFCRYASKKLVCTESTPPYGCYYVEMLAPLTYTINIACTWQQWINQPEMFTSQTS